MRPQGQVKLAAILATFAVILPVGARADAYYVVRVGLVSMGQPSSFQVTASSPFAAFDPTTNRVIARFDPGTTVTINAADGGVTLGRHAAPALYFSAQNGVLTLANGQAKRAYRGWLHFSSRDWRLTAVNELPLETYLAGVLPCEMSAAAPEEALKAQAIAARSYTLRKIGRFANEPYDVDDTVRTQVYKGVEKEHERTTAAVMATVGQVIVFNGRVADAVYGACSGGVTESVAGAFGGPGEPYLVPVYDVDPNGRPYAAESKHMVWSAEFSFAQLNSAFGKTVGEVADITVLDRTESGRAGRVRISGANGEIVLRANDLRWALGVNSLKSTWFNVWRTPSGFRFDGRGWGHGVGLCQEGAVGRAKAGQNYRQILSAYYPGTQLVAVRGEPLAVATTRGSRVERKTYSQSG